MKNCSHPGNRCGGDSWIASRWIHGCREWILGAGWVAGSRVEYDAAALNHPEQGGVVPGGPACHSCRNKVHHRVHASQLGTSGQQADTAKGTHACTGRSMGKRHGSGFGPASSSRGVHRSEQPLDCKVADVAAVFSSGAKTFTPEKKRTRNGWDRTGRRQFVGQFCRVAVLSLRTSRHLCEIRAVQLGTASCKYIHYRRYAICPASLPSCTPAGLVSTRLAPSANGPAWMFR